MLVGRRFTAELELGNGGQITPKTTDTLRCPLGQVWFARFDFSLKDGSTDGRANLCERILGRSEWTLENTVFICCLPNDKRDCGPGYRLWQTAIPNPDWVILGPCPECALEYYS